MHPLRRDVQVSARRAQVRVIEKRLYVVRRHAVFEKPASGLTSKIVEVQIDRRERFPAAGRESAGLLAFHCDTVRLQNGILPRGLDTLHAGTTHVAEHVGRSRVVLPVRVRPAHLEHRPKRLRHRQIATPERLRFFAGKWISFRSQRT